jgi:cytochrome c oxidase cbb3-type subunit III
VKSRGISMRCRSAEWRGHWTFLALLVAVGAGCDLPGRPKTSDRYVPPPQERTFNALFQRNCAGCHGADGKLGPAPPLNDRLYLALIPDTELKRVIAGGRPGTLMPAFGTAKGGHLTLEQVDILAQGIKPRWGPVEPAPSGAPSYLLAKAPPDGAGGANKEEGLKVFARACASCHGDHGQGGQYDGRSVGAINDPDFLALISDQALRRYVIAGRPDLGMPDYADPTGRPESFRALSYQDVTNVVALLADWR